MVLAEQSKLEVTAAYGFNGSQEKMDSQKVPVTDDANGFRYTAASDSFIIDMDSFSKSINQETATNSRITLQRNLNRKGCQRSHGDGVLSSPKDGAVGSAMPEKPVVVAVGAPPDHSSSAQVHHQIIVSTNNNINLLRRNSFRRPSNSWLFDPKRILFFFATLSAAARTGSIETPAKHGLNPPFELIEERIKPNHPDPACERRVKTDDCRKTESQREVKKKKNGMTSLHRFLGDGDK